MWNYPNNVYRYILLHATNYKILKALAFASLIILIRFVNNIASVAINIAVYEKIDAGKTGARRRGDGKGVIVLPFYTTTLLYKLQLSGCTQCWAHIHPLYVVDVVSGFFCNIWQSNQFMFGLLTFILRGVGSCNILSTV